MERTYVIDAHPLVAYIKREHGWKRVEAAIQLAVGGTVTLKLTSVNAGEVIMAADRDLGPGAAHEVLDAVQRWTDVETVDLELAARAAWFKLRGGISYADCFAAALAHRDGIPLITGDPEFRRVEDVVRIAWLETLA